MLRSERGEGERPKHKHPIRKGSQVILATLFLATPICMAQSALALTSSNSAFVKPSVSSSIDGRQPQTRLATLLTSQERFPATGLSNRGLLQSPFRLLTLEDINTIESTLATYKKQLATLKATSPKNTSPNNVSALNTAIRDVETKVSALETALAEAKTAYAKQLDAQETLRRSIANYDLAVSNEQTAKLKADSDKSALSDAELKVQTAQSTLDASLVRLNTAIENKQSAQDAFNLADASLTGQIEITDNALTKLNLAKSALASAQTVLVNTQEQYNQIHESTQNLVTAYNQALEEYTVAYNNYLAKQSAYVTAESHLNQKLSSLNTAQWNYDNLLIPDPNWTPPTYQKEHIRTVLNTRQVEVRTLVPTTTTSFQEQVIPNLLPNPTLTTTDGWSGVYWGWQGSQPGMYDGEITFSYMDQTVSQGLYSGPFNNATLTLSADWLSDWTADSYSMTVTAEDINRNPVGTATYTNTRTAHDWTNRSVTLTATGPVSYITVSFSGIDHGFWYGMYGPRMKNPVLQVTHGEYVTETTYEEVITYEEETYYTYETYYTTEVIQPQQGLTVRVYNNLPTANPQRSDTAYNLCKTTTLTSINHNWSGGDILGCGGDRVMIHYTGYLTPTENITSLRGLADDGFYLDVNGSNVINNWTLKGCSGNWNPVSLEAGKTYEIDAWFFEWGGGACSILNYQSTNGEGVVPEAWYTNAISAPLIKDPALLPALQEAQGEYNEALASYTTANIQWVEAQALQQSEAQESLNAYYALIASAEAENAIYAKLQTEEQNYNSAVSETNLAQAEYDQELSNQEALSLAKASAQTNLTNVTDLVDSATHQYNKDSADLVTAQSERASAQEASDQSFSAYVTAIAATDSSLKDKSARENEYSDSTSVTQDAYVTASNLVSVVSFTEVETLLSKEPDPQPEPEGSPDLPTDLSADNLMDVDLNEVDPTELTEEQAEQLVEAALETFETATEGSPEYEQALDALFLAAQQDDIQVDPALAEIPGVGQAAEAVVAVLNIVGNVGADISPKARKKAQEVVVTTLIVGQIAQTAAIATATASSGSSYRRK